MKRLRFLALAAIVAVQVGCSKNEVDGLYEPTIPSQKISVTVSTSGDEQDDTRASITDPADGSGLWQTEWHHGDQLGGWQSGLTKFSKFEMTNMDNTDFKKATFSGNASTGKTLRLFYPYDMTGGTSSGLYTVDLSQQSVDLSIPMHELGSTMCMISDPITVSGSGTITTGNPSIDRKSGV